MYMAIEIIKFLPRTRFLVVITLINFFQVVAAAAAETSSSGGLVDIGGGRKIYLECRGAGSPTVVLISGTRGAHDDWTDLIDPKNPNGAPKPHDSAVFPEVSNFTRVCAYDRPGTSRKDNTVTDSTPVRQPTTAQQGVADLHALLIAAKEPGPYVLVGHSWGGLIARLFASMYPDEVAGLVLVDSASEFLKSSLTPAQWVRYIQARKKLIESNGLEAPDHAGTLGLLHGSPRVAGFRLLRSLRISDLTLAPADRRPGRRGEPLRMISQNFSTRSTSATQTAAMRSKWSSHNW
jgi:pimeloyl-ACP methyl ester carboxylesterase